MTRGLLSIRADDNIPSLCTMVQRVMVTVKKKARIMLCSPVSQRMQSSIRTTGYSGNEATGLQISTVQVYPTTLNFFKA